MALRTTIRIQLLALAGALALPLAAIYAYGAHRNFGREEARARQGVAALAELTANDAAQLIENSGEFARLLASRPQVRAFDPANCDPLMQGGLHEVFPRFSNFTAIDRAGRIVCSSKPQPGGKLTSVADRDWFQAALGSGAFVAGKPAPGALSGQPVAVLAHPVKGEGGRLLGLVALPIDLLVYRPLSALADMRVGTTVGLVYEDGTVIWRSGDSWHLIGSKLANDDPIRGLLALRSGVAEAAGVDGSPHLQAISPVRGTRWYAYADIPRDAVYADLVRDTWQALLTGLAGLGTSLVLAWLFARRLAAPIRELGDVARAVKSGNAGVRVSPAGPVEVAAAGEQFNAMLDGKRLADENLRHEQLRFRDLAEQSSDWFWEQDADLRFSWVSGKQPVKGLLLLDDLLGKRRWELPIALDEDEWHAHRAMLARREPFSEFSYRMLAPDGSVRWSAVTGKPIFDAAGGFAGYRGTGRDITDRKLAELATRKSEEQLRLVVDNVPAMIAFFDAGRICRFSNQAYAAYHGLTPAQTVGRSEPSLMSDAGRAAMAAVFDQVLRGQTVRYSVQTEDFRQGQVYLQVALVPHQGGGTEFLGYFVLMNNLTELYLAQAGLRESEERFRAIFEACPVPMVLTRESDGVRRDVNPAWEAALGYARAEAVGNNQARLVTFADPADRARLLDIMGATGRVDAVELHLRRKDGEERVAESWMRRLVLGGQSHLLLITRDVTEERESARRIGELNESLERRVSERTDELSAANRELETFAYSVSHDLRAPLRGIDGYARLLQESPAGRLDEEARHHLERIRRGTRRMGQLIDDLLDLARVTRAVIARSQVDVSALAAEIAAELSGTAPERQVAWNIEPGIVVDADPGLLRIVLENLLGNAWKYSRGTPAVRIEVGASAAAARGFEFLVRDNGAGFDMSYADHLFRPFQRLHAASEFEGSGIGLATVQRILQRHGGMIHAEGAVGLGATFMVRTRPVEAS